MHTWPCPRSGPLLSRDRLPGIHTPVYGRGMKRNTYLRPPVPYFGGKFDAATLVWARFGDVSTYVEPFCGMAGILLGRPNPRGVETINDADGYVANFWRALKHAPEQVAHYADDPVSEADLRCRHQYLVSLHQELFVDKLMGKTPTMAPLSAHELNMLPTILDVDRAAAIANLIARASQAPDPEWFDARAAGYWAWGASCWIGSGWCGKGANWEQLPHIGADGKGMAGVHGQLPIISATIQVGGKLPNIDGRGGKGLHGTDSADTPSERLLAWLLALAARLRGCRITCGHWKRVCTPAAIYGTGKTAILLDPPYDGDVRQKRLYAQDGDKISEEAREFALEYGQDERLRIALCGYEQEHIGHMPPDWIMVKRKAKGGYSNQDGENKNAHAERIWFSPHCLKVDRMEQEQLRLC